jgi:hypothetical protein
VVELAHQQQRVGADALAQHDLAARAAAWRGDVDQVAFGHAQLARAARGFITTPLWPATLPATSRIICTPTLPPQAYCMLRAVTSQNG